MTDKFKKNHWYRFNGKAKSVYINDSGDTNISPHEKFMLDGEWHQCKEAGSNHYKGWFYDTARFYDSCDPNRSCIFGDERKPVGEKLYMFDEMSPTLMNIKKLKELKNK